jgi:hypothetical protein
MPTYYVNEAVFSLPERGFVDRTIHALESPLAGDAPLTVTVRRAPLEEGQTLRELVDGEIAASAAKAKSFTVLEDAEATVGQAPAILLRARFRIREAAHYQRQAHLTLDGTWIAVAVSAPFAERATCDETFDRIVHGLTWRRD